MTFRVGKSRVVVAAAALLGASAVMAQQGEALDRGAALYQANCAVCHGENGKGQGPYGEFISGISDLTVLAKENGGVFPIERVYEVIDGRREIKAHGPRSMPIWGRQFNLQAAKEYRDAWYEPELVVQSRILHLIDYLYRLQEE